MKVIKLRDKLSAGGPFVALVSIIIVAGCSEELSSQGQMVRQISLQTSNECRFLGAVTASESMGLDEAMDVTSSYNKVRNATAQMGGNAFIVSSSHTSSVSTVVQADAYSC